MILITIQFTLLISLSLLHFYWSVGGVWGFKNSLPTNEEGERILNPKKIDSVIVGFGLSLFATFYLIKANLITLDLPYWASISAGWFISCIFLLRAIGDFNYVGFFKKVKSTAFASLDSNYFSPLCLVLGIIGVIIEIIF